MTLDAVDYWRVKCVLAEVEGARARAEVMVQQAKWQVAQAAERAAVAVRQVGLDPSVSYRWRDDTCQVEPV